MGQLTLNQNVAECMVATNGFWAKTITNVCTGDVTSVPHGAMDLFFFGFVAFLFCAAGFLLIRWG